MNINLNNWNLDTVPTIFFCIVLPLSLYFAYWLFISGVIGAIRILKSKHWTPIIGKITDSEIRFMKFGGGADDPVSFNFVLKRTYSYVVNGENHISNQAIASDSLYEKQFKPMSKFPKKYGDYKTDPNYLETEKNIKNMIGRPITVYYNPNKPEIACLENKFQKEIFLPIIMGLLFGGGLTFLAYYIVKPIIE
ncbi:hypothetical protein KLA_16095 [Cellulophaga geojensis KL-A]|uniref:DUF3592 domain-containing protein n=1 Tax=Cellulophaga geojensis KL-A TaxID=1328323 RepID=A0ABN0RJT9_9FLAO|nr:DUF3592 domain-containing protein [Cellulophaga geojensis]EWH10946.1 hypothetical protein KLA_16095 [Cellulophaga geojensis KL-A]